MSLSDPTAGGGQRPVNPARKFFIQWQGSQGFWYYFDKEAPNPDPTKKGAKVPLKNPFGFIVLDQLNTIKGFNEKENIIVWANEVRNTQTDLLEVFLGKTPFAKGVYQQIKEVANAKDGNYVKSVYVAFKSPIDGKLCIGNIAMTGASLGSWIEFCKTADLTKGVVMVNGVTQEKKGAVNYVAPVYSMQPLTIEQMQGAIDLDATTLQPFLQQYFTFAPKEGAIVQPVAQPPAQNNFQQQPVNNFGGGQQQSFVPQQSLSNQPVQNGFGMNPIQQHMVHPPVTPGFNQNQGMASTPIWNPNGNNTIPPTLQDNTIQTGIIPAQTDTPWGDLPF